MVKSNKMIPEEIIVYVSKLENRKDSLNKEVRLKLSHVKALCEKGLETDEIQREYKALVELVEQPNKLDLEDLTYDGDLESLLTDPSMDGTLPFLMGKLIKVLNEEDPKNEPPGVVILEILKVANENHLDAEKLYFGGNMNNWFTVIKNNGQAKLTYVSLVIAGDFGPVEHVDKLIENYLKEETVKEKKERKEGKKKERKEGKKKERKEGKKKKEKKKNKYKESPKYTEEDSFVDNALSVAKYIVIGAAIAGTAYGITKLISNDETDIEIPDSIF